MLKKLTRHGNSLALVIDRPILDLLGIDADTPLHITTDGKGLHIEPASENGDRAHVRDGETLQHLTESDNPS